MELKDNQGNSVTSFTDQDVLVATVWEGKGQTSLLNPTADWILPSSGTLTLSISAEQSATLSPQRYYLDVRAETSDGRTIDLWDAYLEVTASAGIDEPPSTYATLKDALVYAPWLSNELSDQNLSDFADHFHAARTWLEGIIQSKWRVSGAFGITVFGNVASSYPPMDTGGENKYIQDILDANQLMLRPRVIEMTAKRAIGTICQSQISPNSGDSNYQRLAARFLAEADSLVVSYTAEFDLNADGYSDFNIPCGVSSIR
ncbi:hypothetical protein ACYOEI_00055 [Singulisphaera rosea]